MEELPLETSLGEAHRAAAEAIHTLRAAVRECPSDELPALLAHAIEVLRQLESIDESVELARTIAPRERAHDHAREARSRAVALSADVLRRYRARHAPD